MPTLWHEERGASEKREADGGEDEEDEEGEGRPAALPLALLLLLFLWSRVALDGDGKQRDNVWLQSSRAACVAL